MNDVLEKLGAGALLAWIALPVLALTVRRSRDWEARSRERALAWVLGLDVALLGLPFLREAVWARGAAALPAAWMARIVSLPFASSTVDASPPRSVWTPLGVAGVAWLALVAVGLMRAGLRALRLAMLRARATPASAATLSRVDVAARQKGIRPPYVLCTDEEAVPFVTGVLRPTLVLPRRLMSALDGVAAELALRHELVHLARLDHWRAAGISLLSLPLWPHPTATRLHAEMVLAREEAVDQEVAPASPLAYSRLLVDAAHFRAEQAVAMASGDLARRIARLTDARALPRASLVAVLACFAAVAGAVVAFPRPAAHPPLQATELGDLFARTDVTGYELREGQQMTLAASGLTRLAVGDPTIADVHTLGGNRLQILGVGPGVTTLMLWNAAGVRRSYDITVTASKTGPLSRALPPQIKFAVGDNFFLPLTTIQRVAVGDPDIVDVAANPDGLHLLAGSPGQTTLMIWGPAGRQESLLSVGQ